MPPQPLATPRVSIIIRTRNRLDLLPRALEDIFAQTMSDLEVIIVDDADEAAAARGFVATLPSERAERVTLVSREGEPHGRWLAANAGLAAARGEFVSLHDDDDYWDETFLAQTVAFLDAHPEVPAVCSRTLIAIERVDEAGVLRTSDVFPFLPELSAISLMDMLRANRIPPISMIYRRSLHDEFGPYDQSLPYLGDWAFYIQVVAKHTIALLDGPPLAYWSHRPDSTGDDRNSISEAFARAATDDAIRDAYVRRGIAQDGLPLFVHIAHESKWTDERAAARSDDLVRRLDALGASVAGLHAELGVVRAELYRRTSLVDIVIRPLRTLRRVVARR